MADRPIIFSAPMVRALLDGRKTQTRRLLKLPTKTHSGGPIYERKDMGGWAATTIGGHGCFTIDKAGNKVPSPERPAIWHQTTGTTMALPYAPGDRLYVREAWRVGAWRAEHWARGDGECDADIAIDYLADEFARREWLRGDDPQMMLRLMNQSREDASQDSEINPDAAGIFHWEPGASPCRIRPSIHMPRWASRLTLTVTEVRVQRLQEISEADCEAEGIEVRLGYHDEDVFKHYGGGLDFSGYDAANCSYRTLWNSLHGPDAWDANPWVVAISFIVQKGNIDQVAND